MELKENRHLSLARRGTAMVSLALAAMSAQPSMAGTVTYTYDTLGRLKTATYSNGVAVTYYYDAAGNRTSVVTSGA